MKAGQGIQVVFTALGGVLKNIPICVCQQQRLTFSIT